jgi:hypothetical protein
VSKQEEREGLREKHLGEEENAPRIGGTPFEAPPLVRSRASGLVEEWRKTGKGRRLVCREGEVESSVGLFGRASCVFAKPEGQEVEKRKEEMVKLFCRRKSVNCCGATE